MDGFSTETFVVICLDSIDDKKERKNVVKHIKQDGKEIINITEEQVNNFAGNMLQLDTPSGSIMVMSTQAYHSLSEDQIERISNYSRIVHSNIPVIEKYGGGSVRCMMAELFIPS